MDTFFLVDTLLNVQKESIMANLQSFENYEDPLTKLLAEDAIESQIIPRTSDLISRLNRIAAKQNQVTLKSDVDVIDSIKSLRNYTLILGAGIIMYDECNFSTQLRNLLLPEECVVDDRG
jgi:hypothetical protein